MRIYVVYDRRCMKRSYPLVAGGDILFNPFAVSEYVTKGKPVRLSRHVTAGRIVGNQELCAKHAKP